MAAQSDSLVESGTVNIDSLSVYREAIQCLRRPLESSEFVQRIDTQPSGLSDGAATCQVMLEAANVPTDSLVSFPSSFPTVKRIPNTQFVVDGFRNAGPWSVSYFLSHFHSDHYAGITNLWHKGVIFCSEVTASLLKHSLQVPDVFVVPLSVGKPVIIDGCEVALVDANHCPGAVQFLFKVPGEAGEFLRYVHCGDMRYHPSMKSEPSLCDYVGSDAVFLDTTYCNPKYVFPSQQESVDYVAETVRRLMEAESETDLEAHMSKEGSDSIMEDRPDILDEAEEEEDVEGLQKSSSAGLTDLEKGDDQSKKDVMEEEDDETLFSQSGPVEGRSTLFLISTYVIGKEKILTAVAKRCSCLIYVTERKLSVLKCLNLENIEVFTTDPCATNVHVVQWSFLGETWPYFRPNFMKMEKAMKDSGYKKVVGFVPTGWTYELKKKTFSVRRKGPFEIHLVPYSEHSNYEELREFVGFIRPKQIIPTVGLDGGGMDSKAVAAMRKHFRNLVDETAGKRNFLKGFHRKPPEENTSAVKETNTGQPVPKAIFGRAARKRKRDGDEALEEIEGTQGAAPIQDLSKTAEEMDVASSAEVNGTSVKLEQQLVPSTNTGIVDSVDAVGRRERSKLSKGLEDVVQGDRGGFPQHVASSSHPVKRPGSVSQGTRPQPSTAQRKLAPTNKSSTRRQGKAQGRQTRSSTSKKTNKTSGIAPASKKALQSPRTSLPPKPFQKAKQASLFSFFRKAGEETVPTVNAPVVNTEHLMILTGNSARDEPARVRRDQKDVYRWGDEYEQLASLLDGNLSKELAYDLLEKAGGDVGVALDLFYSGERVVETEEPPEAKVEVSPPASEHGPIENGFEEKLHSDDKQDVDVGKVDDKLLRAGKANRLGNSLDSKQVVHSGPAEDRTVRSPGANKQEQREDKRSIAPAGDVNKQVLRAFGANTPDDSVHTPPSSSPGTIHVGSAEAGAEMQAAERSRPDIRVPNTRKGNGVKGELVQNGITTYSVAGAEPDDETKESAPLSRSHDKPYEAKKNTTGKKGGSVALPVGKYSPIEHACWESGEAAPYLHLARAFELVEQESGRLRTADMLCNMFRSLLALSPDAVLPAVYLTTNRLAPDFESVDLNIGGSIVSTAVGEVAGVSRAKLREMYTSMGDLGDVAQACRQTQSILRLPAPLRICKVFSTLKQIRYLADPTSSMDHFLQSVEVRSLELVVVLERRTWCSTFSVHVGKRR